MPPAHKYAARVKTVFEFAGVDISKATTSTKYAPIIVGRLDNEILDILPSTKSLTDVLDCLEKYDQDSKNLGDIMDQFVMVNDKPSIDFDILATQIAKAMPNDTPSDTMKTLAWTTMSRKF